MSCCHCLYFSFFPLSLTSSSMLGHASFLTGFPNFLLWGMESSCASRKAFLKCCQLCFVPFSLRTVSQGILSRNSLNSLKFALLKLRVLAPLFARLMFLEITNLTRAWSLPPIVIQLTLLYLNYFCTLAS